LVSAVVYSSLSLIKQRNQVHSTENAEDTLRLKQVLDLKDRQAISLINRIRDVLEREKSKLLQIPNTVPNRKTFNILCIDGGGLRGIIDTILLERIMAQFPDFLEQIDFVAGCSNGAMIAMGVAFGFGPTTSRALLEVCGEIIFTKIGLGTNINSAKFSNNYLKLFTLEAWGSQKLRDAKKFVMIPGFLLDNQSNEKEKRSWTNVLYHNLDLNNPVADEAAADVVMRSAAAPTYFPSYQRHIDGGIFAHDPASHALTLAMAYLNQPKENIRLLSLGTGRVMRYIDNDKHDWGVAQWLPYLTNVIWEGMIQNSEMMCNTLLGDRYHRLNPILDKDIGMDDPAQIPILTKVASNCDITNTISFIHKHIYNRDTPISITP